MLELFITLYIIGGILAYGRLQASMAAIDVRFGHAIERIPTSAVVSMVLLSWAAFLAGVIMYFTCDKEYEPHRHFLRYKI